MSGPAVSVGESVWILARARVAESNGSRVRIHIPKAEGPLGAPVTITVPRAWLRKVQR